MPTKWLVLAILGIFLLFGVIAIVQGEAAQNNSQKTQQQKTSSQKSSHNEKQAQSQELSDDEYNDNADDYDPGNGDSKNDRIYNGFDDFNSPGTRSKSGSVKTVEAHGIQTVLKSYGGCAGLAPNNWTVDGAENNIAVGIGFADAQRNEGASYMIMGVTTAVDAYGNDFYGNANPVVFIQKTLTALGVYGFQYTGQGMRLNDGYILLFWQGAVQGQQVRGFAHYTTFPSTQNVYIIALRYGYTPANQWAKRMNVIYDVAASARCQKRLFPVRNNGYSPSSSASKEPRGSSKDLSTLREETTMEFQNVYSPTTGQHWEASYDDYNPTGPDGPGYYRQVGNSYEKLEEGFPPQ
jgi:hypothetical protein